MCHQGAEVSDFQNLFTVANHKPLMGEVFWCYIFKFPPILTLCLKNPEAYYIETLSNKVFTFRLCSFII